MDLRPRQSKHLVTGKDGTRIYTVEPSVWKAHIEYIHKKHNISEWYMQPSFKWIYEHTKIGYYPRGLAIEKAKEIYVIKGAETDYSLLAHEYGHILGHGHVPDGIPHLMNPIDALRIRDPDDIGDKFEENFREYYEKVLVPAERNRALPGVLALGLIAYGLMG